MPKPLQHPRAEDRAKVPALARGIFRKIKNILRRSPPAGKDRFRVHSHAVFRAMQTLSLWERNPAGEATPAGIRLHPGSAAPHPATNRRMRLQNRKKYRNFMKWSRHGPVPVIWRPFWAKNAVFRPFFAIFWPKFRLQGIFRWILTGTRPCPLQTVARVVFLEPPTPLPVGKNMPRYSAICAGTRPVPRATPPLIFCLSNKKGTPRRRPFSGPIGYGQV